MEELVPDTTPNKLHISSTFITGSCEMYSLMSVAWKIVLRCTALVEKILCKSFLLVSSRERRTSASEPQIRLTQSLHIPLYQFLSRT